MIIKLRFPNRRLFSDWRLYPNRRLFLYKRLFPNMRPLSYPILTKIIKRYIRFKEHKTLFDHFIILRNILSNYMSRLTRKPTICICENKDADQLRGNREQQLRGNREADQRLCFRYTDSTIPPLLNSKISRF